MSACPFQFLGLVNSPVDCHEFAVVKKINEGALEKYIYLIEIGSCATQLQFLIGGEGVDVAN